MNDWIAIYEQPLESGDFTHLNQIANHFSNKIKSEMKAWGLNPRTTLIYQRGYKMTAMVKFTRDTKLDKRLLPNFKFWKKEGVVPFSEAVFECEEDSRREWQFEY